MTAKVLVSLRVDTDPAHAFDVFTREIGAWWQSSPAVRFTSRGDGVLAFEPGVGGRFTATLADGEVFEIGRIRVWEPGRRLVFSYRQATFAPEQITEVEVRFEAVGAQTRVVVEHCGWESIPSDHVARHRMPDQVFMRLIAKWWENTLASFKKRLNNTIFP